MSGITKQNKFSVKRFLKSIDIFAKPIQLTYRGKEKFRSTLGGFFSILLFMFLISVFIVKLRDMVVRNNTSILKNTLVRISNSISEPEDISNSKISFAFKLANYYGEVIPNDPRYGELHLSQFIITMKKNDSDGTYYRNFERYVIPFSKCKVN